MLVGRACCTNSEAAVVDSLGQEREDEGRNLTDGLASEQRHVSIVLTYLSIGASGGASLTVFSGHRSTFGTTPSLLSTASVSGSELE